jgi:hypothetical protein
MSECLEIAQVIKDSAWRKTWSLSTLVPLLGPSLASAQSPEAKQFFTNQGNGADDKIRDEIQETKSRIETVTRSCVGLLTQHVGIILENERDMVQALEQEIRSSIDYAIEPIQEQMSSIRLNLIFLSIVILVVVSNLY